MCPIYGLKGHKQAVYGSAVGLGNIKMSPCKGKSTIPVFAFSPSARLVCISFTQGVTLGYYLVAPMGHFGFRRA